MRVLLTGASSFTGMWFAETLAAAGHTVVAPLTRAVPDYEGLRAARLARVGRIARVEPCCAFGGARFLDLCRNPFDVLCHHAGVAADHRNPAFDIVAAVAATTRNMADVLGRLVGGGLKGIVATGTVFEPDEGIGERPLRAFSPYGLSKSLSYAVTAFQAAAAGVPCHKFVIANPFGPWEQPRFCHHLLTSWRAGGVAEVRTPTYLRDNIHVDLLALAYRGFVEDVVAGCAPKRFGPQGYAGPQGAFAVRFAQEIGPRLGLACPLSLLPQTDFGEPRVRLNITPIDPAAYGWREPAAWDALAAFYRDVV